MSVSAPPNKKVARTANPVKRVVVLLGDEDGNDPTTEDEVEHLRPLKLIRNSGGRSLVSAIFAYDLTKTGERLVDLKTPEKWKRIVEIRQVDDNDEANAVCLFWGELTAQDVTVNEEGEGVIVRASVNPYHFGTEINGGMLVGMVVRDPNADPISELTVHDENISFNPIIDGKPRSNRSQFTHSVDGYQLWISPESCRTETAQNLSNDEYEPVMWTLRRALDTIQRAINPEETWIKNDLEPGALEESIELKSITLPSGGTLPEYLDALLTPFGFSWYLSFGLTEPEETPEGEEPPDPVPEQTSTRSIRIYKITEGTEKKLLFQRPGETYSAAKSNTPTLTVSTDVGRLVNEVVCQGGIEEREITIELKRGWPVTADDFTADDLKKSDPDSSFVANPDAWRLWIANEAGDHTTVRGEGETEHAVPDFASIFTAYVPKRRPIDDCLTQTPLKIRRKPLVEYYLEGAWLTVPSEWGYQVLDDQLGIRFTGDTPPEDFIDLADDARIRITGTIKGDVRVEATADGTDDSPSGRVSRMLVDVSDRFYDRRRVEYGLTGSVEYPPVAAETHDVFYSAFSRRASSSDPAVYTSGTRSSEGTRVDEDDDTTAIQTYADKLLAVEGAADLTVSASTFGINLDFEIGDLITSIEGREISLNRNSDAAEAKRYPQVVGIVHNFETQSTDLILAANDGVIL